MNPQHDPRPATAHLGVKDLRPGMQVVVGVAADAWTAAPQQGLRPNEAFMEMEYRQRPRHYNLTDAQVARTVVMTVTSVLPGPRQQRIEACMPHLDGPVPRLVRASFAVRHGQLVEVVH